MERIRDEAPGFLGDFSNLIAAARDSNPVLGLTHNFYRYPARFSPTFVRAVIETYTEPGDWVLDPFAGGGTTLVEALAAGRNAVGSDISSLATFVMEAKTAILDDGDLGALRLWRRQLPQAINMHAPCVRFDAHADAGYYRNLSGIRHWRLRKAIEQTLGQIVGIRKYRAQMIARCALLRTAQWALDARKVLPSIALFKETLLQNIDAMIADCQDLRERVRNLPGDHWPEVLCINRSAAELREPGTLPARVTPRLVVTSPPYPGIHVLYHRWQVDGRKEAPAPFWIAGRLDGSGSSYYTMGDRKYPELRTYFDNLRVSFESIVQLCGRGTIIVQMVAFSEADWQLPRYLGVLEDCGLIEARHWRLPDTDDGRLWREVPNRKWHARQKKRSPGAKEVVLVHKIADNHP